MNSALRRGLYNATNCDNSRAIAICFAKAEVCKPAPILAFRFSQSIVIGGRRAGAPWVTYRASHCHTAQRGNEVVRYSPVIVHCGYETARNGARKWAAIIGNASFDYTVPGVTGLVN
jgi:hypothetical protein